MNRVIAQAARRPAAPRGGFRAQRAARPAPLARVGECGVAVGEAV